MAFRLNRRRSITTELEKLVHSEFQAAIKELDQPKPGADGRGLLELRFHAVSRLAPG